MGLSGVSMGSLLLILVIVMLVFGTKRLRDIGEDLGAAVKGFRKGMAEGESGQDEKFVSQVKSNDKESS